jgi:D-alanyl-D-alanine dipeptidase
MYRRSPQKSLIAAFAVVLTMSCVQRGPGFWGEAAVAQTPQDERVPAKPTEAPAQWKGLIGEYSLGEDTIGVLEQNGTLFLRLKSNHLYSVSPRGNDTFVAGGNWPLEQKDCMFTRNKQGAGSTFEAGGKIYRRLFFGGEDGRSFRIQPLKPVSVLRNDAMKATPPEEAGEFLDADLVELIRLDSTIHLDIRYATTNNFVGEKFYSQARAFLQCPAAQALVQAHRSLRHMGYGLLIHDAYRPWYVTKMFWDATPVEQKGFVADPLKGSRHNRGCAVDLSLYDINTGQPVEMVSGYDEFSHRAYPEYSGGTSLQRWYRMILRQAMEAEGFRVFDLEWWHFDYKEWRHYPIGTTTFEMIH